jgi:outer membrane protein assembly complex protein YaeT
MNVTARRIVRRLAYAIAVSTAIFVLLHTSPVRRAALRLLESQSPRLLGGELAADELDYRLWRGEVRLKGVRFESPTVSVEAREVFALLPPFAPLRVEIDEPDVRIAPSEGGSGPLELPETLLTARILVRRGHLLVGDVLEAASIDAELFQDGVDARVSVTVGRGELRLEEREFPFGPAGAQLRLGTSSLAIESSRVTSGSSFVAAAGSLSALSPLEGEIRFEHRLEPGDVEEYLPRVNLEGPLEGEGVARKRAGSGWSVEGTLRAASISFDDYGPLALRAPWRFENETLRLASTEVEGYGGRATMEAAIDFGSDERTVNGTFEEIDVRRVHSRIASRASGSFEGTWRGWDFDTMTGSAALSLRSARERDRVPVAGTAQVRLDAGRIDARFRTRVQRLDDVALSLSGSLVVEGVAKGALEDVVVAAKFSSDELAFRGEPFAVEGALSYRRSRLGLDGVELRTRDGGILTVDGEAPLNEEGGSFRLDLKADALELTGLSPAPLAGLLNGTASVSGAFSRPELRADFEVPRLSHGDDLSFSLRASARLRGPLASLEGVATLRADEVVIRDVSFPSIDVELESDTELVRVEGRLEDGRRLFDAKLGLETPYALDATIPLETLPFAEVRRLFPALEEAGTELELAGSARVALSLIEPSELEYRIEAERVLGTYRGIFLGASAPFSIEGDRTSLALRDLILVGEDTAIGVDGIVPLSRDGGVFLHARGATRLELLRPWFPDAEPAGRANIDLRIEGALPDPWLRGEIGIDGASGRFRDVRVENVTARGDWSDEALTFEDVRGEILGGRFRLRGELPAQLGATSPTRLSFEVEDVDPLELVGKDDPRFEGAEAEVALSGILEGVGFDPKSWRGRGALGWVFGSMKGIELRNDGPAPWSFGDGRLELSGLVLSGGEGRLVIDGEARPFDDVPSWTGSASGRIDHSISSLFLADTGVSLTGVTVLDVRASAGPEPFSLRGRGSFTNARLVVREPAIAFDKLTGALEIDERAITLSRATAEAGSGRVEASGRIDFSGERTELDVKASAESIRLSYPEGLRSEVGGDLRLAGAPDSLRLTGDVTLARALFSRDIRLETEILQSLSRVERLSGTSSFASSLELDLRVRAGEAFRIDNNLARMDASVNLAVRGTLAAPELHGVAAARPGGEFRFGGNTYRVETGRIQLRGYPAEPPVLDIKARTAVSGYDIQLVLRGSTDNLATELTAPGKPPGEPDPSRADIASLLLTGRTLDKVSSEGKAIVGERMTSYLGATLADLAELGLGEALPFDIITVEPSLIARETDPAARFTLGARFAETLSLVYSIGLDNADDQIWLVDYQLPRRMRTQLIRNADNEFTAGLTQSLRFDVRDREETEEARTVAISSVSVTLRDDPNGVSEEELVKRLGTKAGHRYDYWKAWDEAERLREYLRSRDYLEATVDVSTGVEGIDAIALEYRVTVGPRVKFVFEGDEPDGSLKKAIAGLWTGSSSEAFLASDVALIAEGKFYEDRYYTARAEVEPERISEREVVVTVRLDRGPRGRRVDLTFVGNDSISRSILERALPKVSSSAFHELITVKRPRMQQALQVQYATRGFVEASVGEPVVSFDESSGVLAVTVSIAEGRLFRVDGIEVEGVDSLNEADLRARLSLRDGEPFRVANFVKDRSTLSTYYREQGFPEVEVRSSVLDRPTGELGAKFIVQEGPRVTVKDVSITGNVATRESVIRRELTLEPGEPVSPSALNEMQRKLYELGVFQTADVTVAEPLPTSVPESSRDLRIAVKEAPDVEVDYGVRVGTDGSFQVLGEARTPNLFGRAQSAGIRALVGSDENIYRFTYRSPYLARLRLVTDFFLERRIEEEKATEDAFGFVDRTWTVTGQQTRPFGEHLNLQWSYTFKRTVTEIDDPDDFADLTLEQNRSILTTALIHDSRTSVIRPTGGNLWSVSFQAAPEALGSDLKFLKLFGQLYTFVPVGRAMIWASGYRLGVADSFGQRLAEDDRFQAGGPSSVRGFAQGSLGPLDPLLGVPLGGSGVLVLNQELRFPLFWKLRGVGFWDAGNAFATPSDISLADLRHSAGAGVRVELPFGLLRFDWAGVIDRKENEDPWRFVFSLGHAF